MNQDKWDKIESTVPDLKEPKCRDCGQPMIEVGVVSEREAMVGWTDAGSNEIKPVSVTKKIKLYQCPEDKTVGLGG